MCSCFYGFIICFSSIHLKKVEYWVLTKASIYFFWALTSTWFRCTSSCHTVLFSSVTTWTWSCSCGSLLVTADLLLNVSQVQCKLCRLSNMTTGMRMLTLCCHICIAAPVNSLASVWCAVLCCVSLRPELFCTHAFCVCISTRPHFHTQSHFLFFPTLCIS